MPPIQRRPSESIGKSNRKKVWRSRSHNSLLLEHNVCVNIVQWYYNYIIHRNIFTEQLGIKAEGTIGIGFPPGGVCSAKFWIIAFNQAINIINQSGALGI